MNKICIIGVYFGTLPQYFELWEKSASVNTGVDFYVFTDQKVSPYSENIIVVQMSLGEMKKMAENKLGFHNLALTKPYKCCDFKPVYGLIFEDYIQQYDYWGHCDFDMIFGDLQGFFEKYDLYAYDKFLPLGHLTLYRNCRDVILRYQCQGADMDYRSVFTSDKSFAFDELRGMTKLYSVNGFSQFTKRIFCDIASIYHRYRDIEEYPLDIIATNHKKQVYYWQKGHVFRKWFSRGIEHKDEYIYIHFKKRPNFFPDFDVRSTNGFYISNIGFFPIISEPGIEAVKEYNHYYFLKEAYETIRNKIIHLKKKTVAYIRRAIS